MRDFIVEIVASLVNGVLRFPVSASLFMFSSIFGTISLAHKIPKMLGVIFQKLSLSALLVAFVYLLTVVSFEKSKKRKDSFSLFLQGKSQRLKSRIRDICFACSTWVIAFFLPKITSSNVALAYTGIFLVLLQIILYVSTFGSNFYYKIFHFAKRLFVYVVLCLGFGGFTSLLICAFTQLIYKIDICEMYFSNIVFWFGCFLVLCLGIIPNSNTKEVESNLSKRVLKNLISSFMIISVVVAVCELKIMIVDLGKIWIYTDFLNFLIILFYLAIVVVSYNFNQDEKIMKILRRFLPLFVICFSLLQIFILNFKSQIFGITTFNYMSWIELEIAIMFAILFYIKNAKFINNFLIITASATIFCTLTRFNILDVVKENKIKNPLYETPIITLDLKKSYDYDF